MQKFNISDRMTVKELKQQFKDAYSITLRVYKGKVLADDNDTLAMVSTGKVPNGELQYSHFPMRSIFYRFFENNLADFFGIKIEAYDVEDKEPLENVKKHMKLYGLKGGDDVYWKFISKNDEGDVNTLHTFKLLFTTKGGCGVEIAPIDTEEYNVDDIVYDDVSEIAYDSDYIANAAISKKFKGSFQIEVYDDEDKLVYANNKFNDFIFISNAKQFDTPEKIRASLTSEDSCLIKLKCENRWEEEKKSIELGDYLALCHGLKWITYTYTIKDTEFDPSKLLFVRNAALDGLISDFASDAKHIFYNNDYLEVSEEPDSWDEYGTFISIERKANDKWEMLRDIEEEEEEEEDW